MINQEPPAISPSAERRQAARGCHRRLGGLDRAQRGVRDRAARERRTEVRLPQQRGEEGREGAHWRRVGPGSRWRGERRGSLSLSLSLSISLDAAEREAREKTHPSSSSATRLVNDRATSVKRVGVSAVVSSRCVEDRLLSMASTRPSAVYRLRADFQHEYQTTEERQIASSTARWPERRTPDAPRHPPDS